ncbi:hypothetical protein ACFSTD_15820 [Novosphingobium colocasiae]
MPGIWRKISAVVRGAASAIASLSSALTDTELSSLLAGRTEAVTMISSSPSASPFFCRRVVCGKALSRSDEQRGQRNATGQNRMILHESSPLFLVEGRINGLCNRLQ